MAVRQLLRCFSVNPLPSTRPSRGPPIHSESKPNAMDTDLSFDGIHTFLSDRLNTSNYIKATDLNRLFHKCESLEHLEQAKEVLARFRVSPSHSRDSQPMTVFRACIKLGVPEEALKMASDPVKYGLFPKSNATHELLMAFVAKDDFEGATRAVELMNELGVKTIGKQHFLLVKVCVRNLLAKHGLGSTDHKEEGNERETEESKEGEVEEGEIEEGKEMEEEWDNVQPKEEGVDITETKEKGIVLKDLLPALELCKTSMRLSEQYGSRGYYFINGKLLSVNLVQLSSQMISQLEYEGILPDKLIVNMKMDNKIVSGDLAGVLSLLQQTEARAMVAEKRLPRLQQSFAACEDEDIKQSFMELNLTG